MIQINTISRSGREVKIGYLKFSICGGKWRILDWKLFKWKREGCECISLARAQWKHRQQRVSSNAQQQGADPLTVSISVPPPGSVTPLSCFSFLPPDLGLALCWPELNPGSSFLLCPCDFLRDDFQYHLAANDARIHTSSSDVCFLFHTQVSICFCCPHASSRELLLSLTCSGCIFLYLTL